MPAPISEPLRPDQGSEPARHSTGLVLLGLLGGVALVVAGFGVGYLLYADDDESSAATTTTTVPVTTTAAPAAELPDDFPVTVGLQFFDDTPAAHRQAVRTEFERSGLFDRFEFEYFGPLDDGPWNTITGIGGQDDATAICDFGRQFVADPYVVGVESRGTNECPDL